MTPDPTRTRPILDRVPSSRMPRSDEYPAHRTQTEEVLMCQRSI